MGVKKPALGGLDLNWQFYASSIAIIEKNPAIDKLIRLASIRLRTNSLDKTLNVRINNGNKAAPFAKSKPVCLDKKGFLHKDAGRYFWKTK